MAARFIALGLVAGIAAIAVAGYLFGHGMGRPSGPPGNLACGLARFEVANPMQEMHATARRDPATNRLDINVLELSAGGEFGAYGAGFLRGWSEAGNAAQPIPRNAIDVVTGVSTGALMSTHAFLGGHDKDLMQFYESLTSRTIYSKRNPITLLWADSLYDDAGKKRLLRDRLTTALIDAVAHAPDDRHLFVGLTDLDSGNFVKLDMVKLARGAQSGAFASTAQRDTCYRAVIDGATAIEVAFPPVFIDGHMFGDGGVRQHVFLVSPQDITIDPSVKETTLRVFTFVHGALDVPPQKVANSLLSVAARAENISVDQGLRSSIELSHVIATDPQDLMGPAAANWPHFETRYASAAEAACGCNSAMAACDANSGDYFCRPFEICLAKRGEADGREAATTGKWLQLPDLHLDHPLQCPGAMMSRFQ